MLTRRVLVAVDVPVIGADVVDVAALVCALQLRAFAVTARAAAPVIGRDDAWAGAIVAGAADACGVAATGVS